MKISILFKFNEMKRKKKLKSRRRTFNLLLEHHYFTRTQRVFAIIYLLFSNYHLHKEKPYCTGWYSMIKHGLKKRGRTDSSLFLLSIVLSLSFKKIFFLFIFLFHFNKKHFHFRNDSYKISHFVNFFCFCFFTLLK